MHNGFECVGVKVKEGKGERGDPFALAIGRKKGDAFVIASRWTAFFFSIVIVVVCGKGWLMVLESKPSMLPYSADSCSLLSTWIGNMVTQSCCLLTIFLFLLLSLPYFARCQVQ